MVLYTKILGCIDPNGSEDEVISLVESMYMCSVKSILREVSTKFPDVQLELLGDDGEIHEISDLN